MAAYNGRRVPNVSQYLANLNAVPNPQEVSGPDDLSLGDDGLDFLTNTQFFDFDEFHGAGNGFQPPAQDLPRGEDGQPFPFADFQSYPNIRSPTGPGPLPGQYAPSFTPSPVTGEKRKVAAAAVAPYALPSPAAASADLEEASRVAAEEDKRRRNTAASARFRVKKKQREQALEKQAKDMSEKVQLLEGKVQQLEMENKWLKELITEKGDVKTVDASLLKKKSAAAATAAAAGQRKTESHTDGVGTDGEDLKGEE